LVKSRDCPACRFDPRSHLVVNVVVVGPLEEEEEGTGIASDLVKVKGEDPANPRLGSEVC